MTGDRDRFRRADAIFDAALDVDTGARRAWVVAACDGDAELCDDVLRLLVAHDRGATFMRAPALRVAAPLLGASAAARPDDAADAALRDRVQRAVGAAYVVAGLVARGGMAAVYAARDPKHQRDVAIKVLDAGDGRDAGDPAAARFLDEIRMTAGLHHPHVLPLFDSGAADGLLYYVMPLVDGETLRDRLRREGALPVAEAVRIATAVAGALEHAHSRGILHRDLKPENILLQDGHPLVADFGIGAPAWRAGAARHTRPGVSLGTPAYMSPEQCADGAVLDARSDVYALAAVTHEMLAGEPPHVGATPQTLLARKLAERPTPVDVLRDGVPDHVARAVERGLARRPVDRLPSARAFADALADAGRAASGSRAPRARRALWAAAAAVVVAAGGAVLWRTSDPPRATRFTIALDPHATDRRAPTLTPDGTRLVYLGDASVGRRVYVRAIDELAARPIEGTAGALTAFVSPDGRTVAFFTEDDRLKTAPIGGGRPRELTGAFRYASGTWAGNDRIVYTAVGRLGLSWLDVADATGGPLTRLDGGRNESRHSAPLALADGRSVLFVAERDRNGPVPADGQLALAVLDPVRPRTAPHRLLGVRASSPVAVVDGWLLYVGFDGTALMAVRFDPERGVVEGPPRVVMEDPAGDVGSVSLAGNGTLLYTRRSRRNTPVLVSHDGTSRPLFPSVTGSFMNPRLSPDGRRLVVQAAVPEGTEAWIFDVATGALQRLGSGGAVVGPTWSADGRQVVYMSSAGGETAIRMQPVDGDAAPRAIVRSDGVFSVDVARGGSAVLYQRQAGAAWSIWAAPLGGGEARAVLRERYDTYMPALAPDGRWLAYAANPAGRYEVFVRPYPGPGAALQVSEGGGTEPAWSADGRSLFYRDGQAMHAARVVTSPGLAVPHRRRLFAEAFDADMPMPHRNYDVTPDGRGFVMIAATAESRAETVVVLDWMRELRGRLRRP